MAKAWVAQAARARARSVVEPLMFMWVFTLLEIQRSYRARKSAVVEAVELAVTSGGDQLKREPLHHNVSPGGQVGPDSGDILRSR